MQSDHMSQLIAKITNKYRNLQSAYKTNIFIKIATYKRKSGSFEHKKVFFFKKKNMSSFFLFTFEIAAKTIVNNFVFRLCAEFECKKRKLFYCILFKIFNLNVKSNQSPRTSAQARTP